MGGALSDRDEPGYLADVPYTGEFYEQLSPARMAYVAAVNGYASPHLDAPFAWCELGCGKGVTPLVLAALHPHGEFYACDFNPEHIAYAEGLRREAGLPNLKLLARSFAAMLDEHLPQFDFVVLHGVYSWVGQAEREQIGRFLRARLKPGGLALVSYNAMPGWSALQPLRRLMRAYAENAAGDSLEKAKAAYRYATALLERGAGLFRVQPAAAEQLRAIAKKDIRYVAHEYLTRHNDAFWFDEVERSMQAAGLAFAGAMRIEDNYPELMMPAAFRELLPPGCTRQFLEAHRDLVMCATFRSDLFAAQPSQPWPPGALPPERFAGLRFVLAAPVDALPLRREDSPLAFDLSPLAPAVGAVHALLARGPADAARIAGAAGTDAAQLMEQLVVAGHLVPRAASPAPRGWPAVNRALVEAALRERSPRVPLACPSLGSATDFDVVEAAAIEASHAASAESAGTALLERVRRHRYPVNREDAGGTRREATDEEVRTYGAACWREARNGASPLARFLELRGLAPAC